MLPWQYSKLEGCFARKRVQAAFGEAPLNWAGHRCATHKHPKVKSWLKYHKRFHVHFTPTSASWLNKHGGMVFS